MTDGPAYGAMDGGAAVPPPRLLTLPAAAFALPADAIDAVEGRVRAALAACDAAAAGFSVLGYGEVSVVLAHEGAGGGQPRLALKRLAALFDGRAVGPLDACVLGAAVFVFVFAVFYNDKMLMIIVRVYVYVHPRVGAHCTCMHISKPHCVT